MAKVNIRKNKIIKEVRKSLGKRWFVGSIVNYAAVQEFAGEPRATPYLRPSLKELKKLNISGPVSSLNDLLAKMSFEVERRAKQKVRVDTANLKGSIAAAPGESEVVSKSRSGAKDSDTLTR